MTQYYYIKNRFTVHFHHFPLHLSSAKQVFSETKTYCTLPAQHKTEDIFLRKEENVDRNMTLNEFNVALC